MTGPSPEQVQRGAALLARARAVQERLAKLGVPVKITTTEIRDGVESQHTFSFELGPVAQIALAEVLAEMMDPSNEKEFDNLLASMHLSRPDGAEA